jgi:ABC-type branched-subunit amino acid transport system permease subunit
MGVIFGMVNILVAIWFYASAVSVKKQAILWAVIGGLSFLAGKILGYSFIAFVQESLIQANLDDLSDIGYTVSEESSDKLSKQTSDDQNTAVGILYEFFPLIMALVGVTFIRAKFILSMGFIDSLKHETPLKFVTKNSTTENTAEEKAFLKRLANLSNWWKQRKSS